MAYFGNQPYSASYLTDYFSGNGSTVAFTLSRTPVNAASIVVTISGVKQAASTYGVSGTTITFSAAPPTGTNNIEVLHLGIQPDSVVLPSYRTVTEFTATGGQTTFSPAAYTVGWIDVYRNGVKLGAADFTATNGTSVVLANAATAGDLIRTESFLITSFNNSIPNTNGAVSSSLLASGAAATNIGAGGVTQSMLANNVVGNGPTFMALMGTSQSVSTGTTTKILFNTESWDTNSCYDATNSKFIPNVAGYYQVIASAYHGGATNTFINFFKNGNSYQRGYQTTSNTTTSTGTALVYCNGTTDYVEVYLTQNTGSTIQVDGYDFTTRFAGVLVRAA